MLERIVEILQHHDADIVLLQEVDWGAPRSGRMNLAAHLARRLGYRYRALGLNVHLRRGMYGNATLSRFPFGRQRNIDLTLGGKKARGAQHTQIRLTETWHPVELELFNVHLSLSAAMRRRQIAHLLETEDVATVERASPCVVAGDMNDWLHVLQPLLFAPAGFRCATNRRPGSRRSIKTYPSFAPTGGLDKIFYRGRLKLLHVHRSRLKLARVASDHLPVIADFELRRT